MSLTAAAPGAAQGQFGTLLGLIGRDRNSSTVICNEPPGGVFRAAHRGSIAEAVSAVEGLSGDVYFFVQPLLPPSTGRGRAKDAVGITCVFADLDADPGKLETIENCWLVIEKLSSSLDSLPVAVVASGHGLQPYWAVTGDGTRWHHGDELSARRASHVLKGFGRLVAAVARRVMQSATGPGEFGRRGSSEADGAKLVDPGVYELGRVLRVPGTWNCKREPVSVDLVRINPAGRPLTLLELEALGGEGAPAKQASEAPLSHDRGGLTGGADGVRALEAFVAGLTRLGLSPLTRPSSEYADGWERRVACPAHALDGREHSVDSLSFGLKGSDGDTTLVWHCHAGCTQADVAAAVGFSPRAGTGGGRALAEGEFRSVPVGRRVAREALVGRFTYATGYGWHRWDGIRWDRLDSDDMVLDAVSRWVDDWLRQLVSDGSTAQQLRDAARYRDIGDLRKLLAASRLEPGVVVAGSDLDAHPWLLNTSNGVIDLRTGTLLPHDPALLMTKVAGCRFVPGARHDDWDKALGALPDAETAAWVRMQMGAAACGVPDRTGPVAFHQGDGANGKSTLIGGIRSAFGDYAVLVPDKLLTGHANEHDTMWTVLHGARLGYLEELPEDHVLPIARIKKLAETAELTGRRMKEDYFCWRPTHTLVVSTNYVPVVNESDHGTWRRLAMIPYHRTFSGEAVDTLLRSRLKERRQMEAILAWIVQGAQDWIAAGQTLEPLPAAIREATEQWRDSADLLLEFLQDFVEPTGSDADAVPTKMLLARFNETLPSGSRHWGLPKFSSRLKAHPWLKQWGLHVGSDSRKRHPISVWGVRIREGWECSAEGAEGEVDEPP